MEKKMDRKSSFTVETRHSAWYQDPKERKKIISLVILFYINLINYMDRFTVSAILSDVSKALCPDSEEGHCSTQKEGFLQTAFVIVYLVVAPIFGYLGDRYSRKNIMAAGVFIWGGLSLTASFMETYWTFLALRASIAIGESAFTTIAPTVLGDLFPDNTRAVVLGIFYIAIPFGSGLGYVVGSAPAEWRNGLRITPGLTFLGSLIILFFLSDPPRGHAEGAAVDSGSKSSYIADLKYISRVKSFLLNVAGFTCVTFMTGSLTWFGPNYVKAGLESRPCKDENNVTVVCEPELDIESIDFLFGAIIMVSGILGVLSGMILSRTLRPKYERIDPIICGVSLLISVPLLVTGLVIAQNHTIPALALVGIGATFLNMNWSVAVDMSLYVIIPTRRATAEAIHLMATHALGEAGSPYFLGVITDSLKDSVEKEHCNDDNKIICEKLVYFLSFQKSVYLAFALLTLGGVLFLLAAFWIHKEKADVDRVIAGNPDDIHLKRKLSQSSEKQLTDHF